MKSPGACARRTAARGFTLLELVLAMALTAMLLAMLSAGVYAVVNDWQRETTVLDDTLDKALVLLQLERALQAAFPHSYVDRERVSQRVYFEGGENELRFVSAVSPRRKSGLTAWHLQSDPARGLQLTLAPAFSDNPNERLDALEPTVLLSDYTASFQYLFQPNRETREWRNEWEGSELQSLPRAVLIVLTPLDPQRGEDVLEIVAPLHSWQHFDINPVTIGF
jgi:general secretion pathway protein J